MVQDFVRSPLHFFCLAIVKGPPNDIYFIIEGPCLGYFTEKVSQARLHLFQPGIHCGNSARCCLTSFFSGALFANIT